MRTKKNVEAAVSARGSLLTIVVNLVKYIQEFGGNVDQCLYLLAQPEGDITIKAVAKLIAEAGQAAVGIFHLVVDYTLSLSDLIALGGFDRVNPNITAEHFSAKGKGKQKVKVELWHPNKYFSNGDEVIAELKTAKPGYRFATLWELITLAINQPDLQRQFPIAALGSIWLQAAGDRLFAFLDGSDSECDLYLGRLGFDFLVHWRFAVVREQS